MSLVDAVDMNGDREVKKWSATAFEIQSVSSSLLSCQAHNQVYSRQSTRATAKLSICSGTSLFTSSARDGVAQGDLCARSSEAL